MAVVFYVSHPEVVIDAAVPVPRWHLSEAGVRRMRHFSADPSLAGVRSVWASTEAKAIEAAGILAGRFGLPVAVRHDLGENDRSATGYLAADAFERMADRFFGEPDVSADGWERAVDAQARVLAAFREVLDTAPPGDVAIVGHGAVGTLLYVALSGHPIDRRFDQPFGGHVFTIDRESRRALTAWTPIAPR